MAVTRKTKRIILWSLAVIIVLLVATRLLAPTMIEKGIVNWFEQQSMTAKVAEVNIDLTNAHFDIKGITASKQGDQRLKLDEVSTDWSWSGLFDSRALVHTIKLDGLKFDVEQSEDGKLIIAGIDLEKLSQPAEAAVEPAPETESKPVEWTVYLQELVLSNFDICYRKASELDYCSSLKQLSWQGDLNLDLSQLENTVLPLKANGDFDIDSLQVRDNKLDRNLLSFKQFKVPGINIDSLASVALKQVTLDDFDGCYAVSAEQDFCNQLKQLSWQGNLNLDLSQPEGPPPVVASGDFTLAKLQVHDNKLDRDLVKFEQFAVNGINIKTLASVALKQITLDDFDACYQVSAEQDYCNQLKQLSWQGDLNLDLTQPEGPPPVVANGDFKLAKLQVHDNKLDRDMVNFNQLALTDINIDTLDSVAIQKISLAPLTLLNRPSDELSPQITRFESIEVSDLSLNKLQQLKVQQVLIKDHEALLINKSDKTLEISDWLPPATEQQTADDSQASNDESQTAPSAFQYAIEKFIYQTGKSVRYQDNSLDKPFIVDLNNINLTVENLDSSQPEQDSKVKYSAQYAEHGKIVLEGTARPLSAKPSFDLSGNIAGLDLRDLSPFTNDAIGHAIKSGQLDAELKLNAKDNILDSKIDLKLYHFLLTAKSPEAEAKIDADFGYPLNSSLSLLKDSDNTIELSIPVTGDLDNPDFDTNDVIRSATSNAITSAIISYYTPFGLVMLVEGVIDLATALDFKAAVFNAGEQTLDAATQQELQKLSKLMNERPGIHLTLCSFSNSADRKILFPETAEIPADALKLEAAQIEKLIELGESRSQAVKKYLVDQKIDASRLVLCTAEHEEGEGLSGVEISI